MGREGAAPKVAEAVGLARQAYANLRKARACYKDAMLLAVRRGATFAELARALELSEPAVRGFVRRAQRRSE